VSHLNGDSNVLEGNSLGLARERWTSAESGDNTFRIALFFAVMMHASLFIQLGRTASKVLGDEAGSQEAIGVTLITEADFLSKTTSMADQSPPQGAPSAALPPPAPQPQQAQPESQVQPEQPPVPQTQSEAQQQASQEPPPPEVKSKAKEEVLPAADAEAAIEKAEQRPPEPEAKKASPASKEPKPDSKATEAMVPSLEKELPDLFKVTEPSKTPNQKPKQATKPAPKQQTAKLDLTPPSPLFSAPGGGGRAASFQRPAGITRSGLNDAFARGVIRALQQTMPQLRETRGRVTVRIFLDENGNVKEVAIVAPSPISNLNQSVVFAARQTSYPIPPGNSNIADRTFLITYIYN
jgi:protein TonB